MNELIKLVSSYSLTNVIIIGVLAYVGIKWIVGQVKEQRQKLQASKQEYHNKIKNKELKDEELEKRLQDIEAHLKTDYEKIQKAESHLYQIESTMKDISTMTINIRIQSLRKSILDFTNRAIDTTNANISREEYAEIGRMYEEYEKLLKECGRENGLIDYSYRCILHSLETREKNKLFLEDFYISPAESIKRMKENRNQN